MTGSATQLVVLLGHPVGHSVSPAIHSAAFAATATDAVYVACDVAPEDLPAALDGLGALGALGANVTVPHKRAAWEVARHRSEEATLIGAANTLSWREGALHADNTDAAGLARVLHDEVGLEPGAPVLLFGAGGAARAAAVALGRHRAEVEVLARRPGPARTVADLVVAAGGSTRTHIATPRLVVNATPLGLHGETPPARLCALGPGQTALDLVYGPADSPFLAAARRAGAAACDGLGMLVEQAALSFETWTGERAPRSAMAAAARAALQR